MATFKEMLRASYKSDDTEERIDIWFNRPVGLVLALAGKATGTHPNTITIISIFLGVAAGWMFHYTDTLHNLLGVLLLMAANFCDSADGQLARLTGKKTLVGRVLDGFSGDLWFTAIYAAIAWRLMNESLPFLSAANVAATTSAAATAATETSIASIPFLTDGTWGIWIWLLCAVAGLLCHSPQSSLADYYRQVHLYFLKGKEGSELDNYTSQKAIYDALPKRSLFARAFYYNYANYCRSQEQRTPACQRLLQLIKERHGDISLLPAATRERFLEGSRPLMKYTNILTFNWRAFTIYATCLLNCPWVYLLVEITVMTALYRHMNQTHEKLCKEITI